jgi:DNA replication ATP-dependent helicase Dna2
VDPSGQDVRRHVAIPQVLDIEEYVASPRFGLKGQIDLTARLALQAPAPPRGAPGTAAVEECVAPMEVKTGMRRDTDRAQVLLYLLLLEERYGRRLGWGLLWYKGDASPALVARQAGPLAAILSARNAVAAALARGAPPPLTSAPHRCTRCFARDRCALAHAAAGGDAAGWAAAAGGGGGEAQLRAVYEGEAGHLIPEHAAFLRHWEALIDLEAAGGEARRPLVWSVSGAEREALGGCVSGLVMRRAQAAPGGGGLYTLARADGAPVDACAFQDGDLLVLSMEGRQAFVMRARLHAAAAGALTLYLDKPLRPGLLRAPGEPSQAADAAPAPPGEGEGGELAVSAPAVRWRLDREEISSTFPGMRSRLYQLFSRRVDRDGHEDPTSAQAARLRRLVVDLAPPAPPPPPPPPAAAPPPDAGLNPEQAEAVRRAVVGEDYTLVLGMPGSGKTTAIVAMVRALAAAGKSVLVTSYTNSAVDNILLKLAAAGDVPFVRVGRAGRVHPALEEWLPEGARHGAASAAALRALSGRVRVAGVSSLGVDHVLVRRRQWDVAIVDEAGQITLPAVLGPLLRARAFVLVGDHHQLPPLVASAEAEAGGLGVPLFRRLAEAHPAAVVTLPVQYRMAADIMALPNLLTYGGALRCGSPAVAAAALALPPGAAAALARAPAWARQALDPARRVVFLDTGALAAAAQEAASGGSVANPGEGRVVLRLLGAAAAAGVPQASLGAISPYRSQVALLEGLLRGGGLPGVECLTVDRAQGRDKECVVVSLVRSNPGAEAGRLLADARRVNVALTRAKGKLVLVGDARTLRSLELFARLLGACEARGWVLRLPADALEG